MKTNQLTKHIRVCFFAFSLSLLFGCGNDQSDLQTTGSGTETATIEDSELAKPVNLSQDDVGEKAEVDAKAEKLSQPADKSVNVYPDSLCHVYRGRKHKHDDCMDNADVRKKLVATQSDIMADHIFELLETHGHDALEKNLSEEHIETASPSIHFKFDMDVTVEDVEDKYSGVFVAEGSMFAIKSILAGGMTVIVEQVTGEILMQAQLLDGQQREFLRSICYRPRANSKAFCHGKIYFRYYVDNLSKVSLEMIGSKLSPISDEQIMNTQY